MATLKQGIVPHLWFNTQDDIDCYWKRLASGGQESMGGWLKDRFVLSWQIVPSAMDAMLREQDPEKVARVTQAFLRMKKFGIAALRRAYEDK